MNTIGLLLRLRSPTVGAPDGATAGVLIRQFLESEATWLATIWAG